METLQFSVEDTLEETVRDVFSTMASTELVRVKEYPEAEVLPSDKKLFIGTVPFAGNAIGLVHIFLPSAFAAHVSSAMLGLTADEIGESDICDVVSELSNMVGGRFKSVLSDSGIACELSLPTVLKGQEITIKTELQGGSCHTVAFQHEASVMRVELALKLPK